MEKQEKDYPALLVTSFLTVAIAGLVIILANMLSLLVSRLIKPTPIPPTLVAGTIQQLMFVSVIPIAMYIHGNSWKDLFQLRLPSRKAGLVWGAIFLVYIGSLTGVLVLLERNQATEAMLPFWYQCKGVYRLIFIFNVILLAPLGEEIMFRGYLFGGISRSSAGPITAAIASTFAWTMLHSQYFKSTLWPELMGLFIMGLLLCAIRHKTRSLWLPVILHVTNNCIGVLILWVES